MDQRQMITAPLGVNASTRHAATLAAALVMLAGASVGLAQSSSLNQLGAEPVVEEPAATPPPQPGLSAPDLSAFNNDELFGDSGDEDMDITVDKYDLVDLHVQDEDLGRVLQLLSILSERNIVAHKDVSATVTADLYGVTFYDALDAILHVNGYGYIEQNNFIYVYTQEQLEQIIQDMREPVTEVYYLNYLNAADAGEFVKQLLSKEVGTITTSVASEVFGIPDNAPVGSDTYANTAMLVIRDYEENVEAIKELLAQLDTKPVQVLVEATILQTSLTEDNAFGVDFSVLNNIDFVDFAGGGGPLSVVNGLIDGLSTDASGTEVPAPLSGNGSAINSSYGNVGGAATLKAGIVNEDVAVFLRLLDEVTDVTVVSNPKILTLNRQPARVLVGTRVGYLNTTTTETSTTQTVEFLDTGTQLALRPFVADNGLIRLELKPQVSNFTLRETTGTNGDPVTIPDEETTELVTNVMVRDSQTVVLGGLFTESTAASRRQVPFFGDIPVIGAAFRGHEDTTRRSEIIFMITPSIVNDTQLAEAGNSANDHLTYMQREADRRLLPWSRERRSAQLLIKAREYAAEGNTERALHCVNRALYLHPGSSQARAMKTQLTGKEVVVPSNSILDSVWGEEFRVAPGGKSDSMSTIRRINKAEPKAAATEQVSSASSAGFEDTGLVSGETGAAEGASDAPVAASDSNPWVESVYEPVNEADAWEAQTFDDGFDDGFENEFQERAAPVDLADDYSPATTNEFAPETSDSSGFGAGDVWSDDEMFEDGFADATPTEFEEQVSLPPVNEPGFSAPDNDPMGTYFAQQQGAEGVNPEYLEFIDDSEIVDVTGDATFEDAFPAEASAAEPTPGPVGPMWGPFFPNSVYDTDWFAVEQPVAPSEQAADSTMSMFDQPSIDGLRFTAPESEWTQAGANGRILGPVLAPAGSEVLWIPLPDGRMLRVPLISGEPEVLDRGYPLDQFATAPTSAGVQDEVND